MRGSSKFGLIYGRDTNATGATKGFVDSDFAGCLDSRKSVMSYVFTMFGCAVSWKSNLQKVVALSSIKIESITVIEAIKETLWITGMINELGVNQEILEVQCDNQAAIHLTRN